ncbi:unnamed protein product [Cylicostephanus goldi]|uniref:Uncharacterized protein n=1 Tax=Cylicostephanus goldi TaxID=71465 RepID=A0A3P6R655_CYLGO|nr:unnamed protein product [Cylicostephanus goldi]
MKSGRLSLTRQFIHSYARKDYTREELEFDRTLRRKAGLMNRQEGKLLYVVRDLRIHKLKNPRVWAASGNVLDGSFHEATAENHSPCSSALRSGTTYLPNHDYLSPAQPSPDQSMPSVLDINHGALDRLDR